MPKLEDLKESLTRKQWLEFTQTAEYLRLKAQENDPTGSKAAYQWLKDRWQECLDVAKSLVFSEAEEEGVPFPIPDQVVTKKAERMFQEQGMNPPHWGYACDCETCGIVPVPKEMQGKRLSCPWCDTWAGEQARSGGYVTH